MNILITGTLPLTTEELTQFSAQGLDVTVHKDEREPVQNPEQYEAVVCNNLFAFTPVEQFTALKLIQLTSAGYDRAPMDYAKAHGITVKNAKGVYSVPMAEFALCGILQLYKKSKFFHENQKAHRWEKHRGLLELSGKAVCIVGTGDVGTEIAIRLKAFGCHVVGVNRTIRENAAFDELLPLDKLPQAAARCDILALTIALTEETKAVVRQSIPSQMREGSVLVNLARGALLDENEVIAALQSGKLSGAVLDVFEQEPLPEASPLWDMEHVILTPHNSFVCENNQKKLRKLALSNLTSCE